MKLTRSTKLRHRVFRDFAWPRNLHALVGMREDGSDGSAMCRADSPEPRVMNHAPTRPQ